MKGSRLKYSYVCQYCDGTGWQTTEPWGVPDQDCAMYCETLLLYRQGHQSQTLAAGTFYSLI